MIFIFFAIIFLSFQKRDRYHDDYDEDGDNDDYEYHNTNEVEGYLRGGTGKYFFERDGCTIGEVQYEIECEGGCLAYIMSDEDIDYFIQEPNEEPGNYIEKVEVPSKERHYDDEDDDEDHCDDCDDDEDHCDDCDDGDDDEEPVNDGDDDEGNEHEGEDEDDDEVHGDGDGDGEHDGSKHDRWDEDDDDVAILETDERSGYFLLIFNEKETGTDYEIEKHCPGEEYATGGLFLAGFIFFVLMCCCCFVLGCVPLLMIVAILLSFVFLVAFFIKKVTDPHPSTTQTMTTGGGVTNLNGDTNMVVPVHQHPGEIQLENQRMVVGEDSQPMMFAEEDMKVV